MAVPSGGAGAVEKCPVGVGGGLAGGLWKCGSGVSFYAQRAYVSMRVCGHAGLIFGGGHVCMCLCVKGGVIARGNKNLQAKKKTQKGDKRTQRSKQQDATQK